MEKKIFSEVRWEFLDKRETEPVHSRVNLLCKRSERTSFIPIYRSKSVYLYLNFYTEVMREKNKFSFRERAQQRGVTVTYP